MGQIILKEKALQLAGLKKFLLDYTLIKDKQPLEVKLLEDYLVYAQMMGIAKTVSKQFSDLYPDVFEQSHFSSYSDILLINSYASSGISSYEKAQNYSYVGEGFSSGGGGGGSFGGGGSRWWLPLNRTYNPLFQFFCSKLLQSVTKCAIIYKR